MFVPDTDSKNHLVSSENEDKINESCDRKNLPIFSKENICELKNSCYMKKKIISAIKKSLKNNNNPIQHTLTLDDVSVSEEKELGNGCRQSLNIRIDLNDKLFYSSQDAGAMSIETFKLNDTTTLEGCSKCTHCSDKEHGEDNSYKPCFICMKCGRKEKRRWFHEDCKEKCCINTCILCDNCLKHKLLSNDHNFDVLKDAKFNKYMYVVACPNGDGLSLHMDYEKIMNLTEDQQRCVAEDFLREAFKEDDKEFAQFTIAIVHNGAGYMPDLLKLLAELHPSLPVKTTKLKCNIETEQMDLGTYYTKVKETYNNGTFAFGPLNETQAASVKNDECGAYMPELLSLLEKSPFLSLVLPWSDMTTKRFKTPHESDDGPIFWCRPGEQIVSLDRNSKRNRWNADEIETFLKERQENLKFFSEKRYIVEELKKYRRSYSSREFLFEDRTRPHADQVWGNHFEPTAAVGVIQAIHPDGEPEQNRACKEIVVFHAKHFEMLEALLHIDVTAAPKQQCAEWLDDAKLNMIRQMNIRFSKLHLYDNDIYFIPRKIVHQFKTISATLSVAWHTRLIEYYREPDPSLKENVEDLKNERSRSTTPITPKKVVKKRRKISVSSDGSDFEITPKKKKKVISRSPSPFSTPKKGKKIRSRSCTPKKTPKKAKPKTPKKQVKVMVPEIKAKSRTPSPVVQITQTKIKSPTKSDEKPVENKSSSEKERHEKSRDKSKDKIEYSSEKDRERSKSKKKKRSRSKSRSPRKHDKKRSHELKDKDKRSHSHSSYSKSDHNKNRSHSHHSSKSKHRHHDKDRKTHSSRSPRTQDSKHRTQSKEDSDSSKILGIEIPMIKVEPKEEPRTPPPSAPSTDGLETPTPAESVIHEAPIQLATVVDEETASNESIETSKPEEIGAALHKEAVSEIESIKSEPSSPRCDVFVEKSESNLPSENELKSDEPTEEVFINEDVDEGVMKDQNDRNVEEEKNECIPNEPIGDKVKTEDSVVNECTEIQTPIELNPDNRILDSKSDDQNVESKSNELNCDKLNSDESNNVAVDRCLEKLKTKEVTTSKPKSNNGAVKSKSNEHPVKSKNHHIGTKSKSRDQTATALKSDKPNSIKTKKEVSPVKEHIKKDRVGSQKITPKLPEVSKNVAEPIKVVKKPVIEVKKDDRKERKKLWDTPLFSFEDCDKFVLTTRQNLTKNGDKIVKSKTSSSLQKLDKMKKRSRSRSLSPVKSKSHGSFQKLEKSRKRSRSRSTSPSKTKSHCESSQKLDKTKKIFRSRSSSPINNPSDKEFSQSTKSRSRSTSPVKETVRRNSRLRSVSPMRVQSQNESIEKSDAPKKRSRSRSTSPVELASKSDKSKKRSRSHSRSVSPVKNKSSELPLNSDKPKKSSRSDSRSSSPIKNKSPTKVSSKPDKSKKRSRSRSRSPNRKKPNKEKKKSLFEKKSLENYDKFEKFRQDRDAKLIKKSKEERKSSKSPERHERSKKHKHRSHSKTHSEEKKVTTPVSGASQNVENDYSNLKLIYPRVEIVDISTRLRTNANNNVIKYDCVDESTSKEDVDALEERNQK